MRNLRISALRNSLEQCNGERRQLPRYLAGVGITSVFAGRLGFARVMRQENSHLKQNEPGSCNGTITGRFGSILKAIHVKAHTNRRQKDSVDVYL